MNKPKIIVICGPTASGKSDLAVDIAKKIGGEVISADSRQVYKRLDIGTGKITKKEMKGIPHYLLDVVGPKKKFSVSDFQKHGEKAIQKILNKNKTPIICGGTGFYIDALVSGNVFPEVPPNSKLRKSLEKKSAASLFKELLKFDSKRAQTIDQNNKVRLIRAIEIVKALGKVPEIKTESKYEVLKIGVCFRKEIIQKRIHDRLVKRIKMGMLREAEKLHANSVSWKRMDELGLEYRYLALYLQKKITKEEMITKLNTKIWHYAKRQMTWFKRDKNIKWFKPTNKKIFSEVKKFLQ